MSDNRTLYNTIYLKRLILLRLRFIHFALTVKLEKSNIIFCLIFFNVILL